MSTRAHSMLLRQHVSDRFHPVLLALGPAKNVIAALFSRVPRQAQRVTEPLSRFLNLGSHVSASCSAKTRRGWEPDSAAAVSGVSVVDDIHRGVSSIFTFTGSGG